MKMEKDFEGKTALVTGGSRGIGRAVCLDLAKGGARVAVNYTSNREAAEETVQTIIQVAVRLPLSKPMFPILNRSKRW